MNRPVVANESLVGLRVLDLSRVLADTLYCQLLGDHGADVIKVEPPAGDDTRRLRPPFVDDDMRAYFNAINRNKRNICLDLRTDEGHQVLERLFKRLERRSGKLQGRHARAVGLPDEFLLERHPRLIIGRITGFGEGSPMGGMPGCDAVAQAFGGLRSINGEATGPALRIGVPLVDMVTGIYAFSGILLALNARRRTGHGQIVDCTLADTAVSLLHPRSASNLADGRIPGRTGSAHPTVVPYDSFTTADGSVFIGIGDDRRFRALGELLGDPGLADDPRFRTNADLENRPVRTALLNSKTANLAKDEPAQRLISPGIPASAIRHAGEIFEDAHVRHREWMIEKGGYCDVGFPNKLTGTPASVRDIPRTKGYDTRPVLRSLGYSVDEISSLLTAKVAKKGLTPELCRI